MTSFSFTLHISALILLAFSSLSSAQKHVNITLGSSLTPLGPQTSWISPSNDFAFGFRPLDSNSSSFLLAIWFEKVESKTVVWYAVSGRQALIVEAGARVELTADGRFILRYQTSTSILWSANTVSNASYAAMLDTGNFVIVGVDKATQWESFQDPRDTMLPSQALSLNTVLLSRVLDTDYSMGRFKLGMQSDGNLVLYNVNVPSGYQYGPYWASDTVGNGSQLIFNRSGTVNLVMRNNNERNITSAGFNPVRDFYQRASLDPDGVFRQYVHPKNINVTGWPNEWTSVDFLPKDICHHYFQYGGGICGFNSYCQSGEDSRVDCKCPPQYSFIDPARKYKGCKPDFATQTCQEDESEAAKYFDLQLLTGFNWPFGESEVSLPIDEDQCRKECLTDCFCALAVFDTIGGGCWMKRFPFSNGIFTYDENNSRVFLKVSKGNSTLQLSSSTSEESRTVILVGSLLLGSSLLVLLLVISLITYICNRRASKSQPTSILPMSGLRSFTYRELEEATHDFSDELGRGASAVVYKGMLNDEAETRIAVKKLDKVQEDTEKEFMNEVRSIGQTYHKNLVRLLGFCCRGTDRLLVYEFMRNGSLMSLITGDARPSWDQRAQIAVGIARGLLYLHEECVNQIIHCDIKPQNVLLDENLMPRISDFGLAKLLKMDQTRTRTDIRGTKGYVAPEWFRSAGVSSKVDVYSFGVMLLEIICCRRNVELDLGEAEAILTDWANDSFHCGRLDVVLEGEEDAMADMRRVERFVKVALWCLQEEPSMRPTMQKVTQMLDGSVIVPIPPECSSYLSSLQ